MGYCVATSWLRHSPVRVSGQEVQPVLRVEGRGQGVGPLRLEGAPAPSLVVRAQPVGELWSPVMSSPALAPRVSCTCKSGHTFNESTRHRNGVETIEFASKLFRIDVVSTAHF